MEINACTDYNHKGEYTMITVYGRPTTLKTLKRIKTVTPPNAGKRWRPIKHAALVETILDEVHTRGWQVTKELYTTANDGAVMAGALLLDKVGNLKVPTGMDLALGFLNNNDRRRALQLTVGANVTCCTNGLCTGTILLNRVHDYTVDLIGEIEEAIDKYAEAAAAVPKVVTALKQTTLSQEQASEILMEAGRQGLTGWANIGRVDKEYRNPTFAEHGTNTAWALLNAFTYAGRGNIHPTNQMVVYNKFRALLPGGADLN